MTIDISVPNLAKKVKQPLQATVNHKIPNILSNSKYWTEPPLSPPPPPPNGALFKMFSENM